MKYIFRFFVFSLGFVFVFLNFGIIQVHADDLSSGLVGHWSLDEENPVNGTSVSDSSSNNHNGIWHSSGEGTYSSAGKIGNAGIFEKGIEGNPVVDGQFIEIPDHSDFSFTNGFSTSFWVKPTSWNIWNIILSKDVWDSGGWMIGVYGVSHDKGNLCYGKASYTDMCSVVADEALTLNTWSQVVINNDNGSVKMYVNGALVASGSVPLSSGNLNYNTNYPMNIGIRDNSNPTDFFNGLIDDVRVYNRVLTVGEIANINNSAIPPSFNIESGEVLSGSSLTITSSGSDHIYYTIDGSTPTSESTEYTTPITLDGPFPMTAKAFAVKDGLNDSAISTAEYSEKIFIDGSGLVDDPYKIQNCEQLQKIGGSEGIYLDKYFRLEPVNGNTIDCSGIANFVPIGNLSIAFTGSFDGANFDISNLTINRPEEDQVGLFGVAGSWPNSSISNVNLKNINIIGNKRVGGLIGYVADGVNINNSSANGYISGVSKVGGLVGSGNQVNITDSYNTGNVSGDYNGSTTEQSVGGLLGAAYNTTIENSYNTGNINVIGTLYVGGLVGSGNEVNILKSYNTGVITGDNDTHTVGGLVGSALWPEIENSYNSGSISGHQRIGGLIGFAPTVYISNSYNSGTVNATYSIDAEDEGGDGAGGLVGINSMEGLNGPFPGTGNSLQIENSFNVGIISASKNIGGILGLAATLNTDDQNFWEGARPAKTVTLSNNFYYKQSENLNCNDQIEGIETIACDSKDTFNYFKNTSSVAPFIDQWDFSETPIWYIQSHDYPKFTEEEIIPESEHHHTSSGSYLPGYGPRVNITPVVVPTNPINPTAPETKFIFTKNLKKGMTDTDVKELQKFLNSHGYPIALTGPGSVGFETIKFGSLTQKALIKFQLANKIKPSLGYFGPLTRGVVNGM